MADKECVVYTRGKRQPRSEAVEHRGLTMLQAFDTALKYSEHAPDSEPVMFWENSDLAVGEVDFHGAAKYAGTLQEALWLQPAPARAWVSHGGGLKGVFEAKDPCTGDEVAAIWCYAFRNSPLSHDCTGLETMLHCAHPWYLREGKCCSEVKDGYSCDLENALNSLLGEPCEADITVRDSWLEENGMELGQRYEHSHCPIEPEHISKGTPVTCYEDHIYCFSCGGRGVCFEGYRRPGYVGYLTLARMRGVRAAVNLLRTMAYHRCHWPHANLVFKAMGVPEAIAKKAYKAFLKRLHLKADDTEIKRIQKAILNARASESHTNIVRTDDGLWRYLDLISAVDKEQNHLLDCLPACQCFNDKGKLIRQHFTPVYGMLMSGQDITDYGYPPLHVVHGVDMWPNRIPDGKLRVIREAKPPYKAAHHGWNTARAEAHLQAQFPGINLQYLRLALYAKAYAQLGKVEPPMVYATGQSGSGKTMTWILAGEIGLVPVQLVKLSKDSERFRQEFAEASRHTDCIFFDEVAKDPRLEPYMAGLVLSLRNGLRYHHLYVGSREIHKAPAILFADTLVVRQFWTEVQLARRTVYVDLGPGRVGGSNWQNCNTGNILTWRSSPLFLDNAAAADTFLADVIAKLDASQTFEQAAASLGFHTMDKPQEAKESEEVFDPNAELLALFEAVCNAPEQTEEFRKANSSRWKGRGWKVFHMTNERTTPLAAAWFNCVGEQEQDMQRVMGAQWGELIGAIGIRLDLQPYGQWRGLRFIISKTRQNYAVNSEIKQNRESK